MSKKRLNKFSETCNKQLHALFSEALKKKQAFEFANCLLRTGGMQDQGWDELIESNKTIKSFQELLHIGRERLSKTKYLMIEDRVTLFLYCHLIEMPSPYHVIANLLRLTNGNNYTVDPFGLPERSKKIKTVFGKQPVTYPKGKIKIIKNLDNQNLIYDLLDEIYDDKIRNAFYHSDFVITKNEFRIPSLIIKNVIPLKQVKHKVHKAFIFYDYLFRYIDDYRKLFFSLKDKEFDLFKPYGEKLKFLYEGRYLIGFEITRPNNTNSRYTRTKKGTQVINLHFTDEGEIGFFVGNIDLLKEWYETQDHN